MASSTCSVHIGHHQTLDNMILAATQHLVSMYSCLSRDDYSPAALATHCRKFMLLYVELEKHAPAGLWKMKPKFHMAQELCEFDLVTPWLGCTEMKIMEVLWPRLPSTEVVLTHLLSSPEYTHQVCFWQSCAHMACAVKKTGNGCRWEREGISCAGEMVFPV